MTTAHVRVRCARRVDTEVASNERIDYPTLVNDPYRP